jgi:hypothetical protein
MARTKRERKRRKAVLRDKKGQKKAWRNIGSWPLSWFGREPEFGRERAIKAGLRRNPSILKGTGQPLTGYRSRSSRIRQKKRAQRKGRVK